MKATAIKAELKLIHTEHSLQPELTLTLADHREQVMTSFNDLQQAIEKGKKLAVTIEPARKRRSLDANAYLWVLLSKMSEALRTTKEEIYRKLVRDVGQFEIVPIRHDATSEFIRMWSGRGLGWSAEVEGESKLDGYNRVVCYFGSSVYDTKQMSILIDEAVTQAQEIGVETLPPNEIEALKNLWGG